MAIEPVTDTDERDPTALDATPTAPTTSVPAEPAPAEPEPAPAVPTSERLRRLLYLAAPSLVFLAVRLLGLLSLAWLASAHRTRVLTKLTVWDGQWLLGIASGGYAGVPDGLTDAFGNRTPVTALAFFPGYPGVVATVRFLVGTPLIIAGLAVALIAGLVMAHGLARLGEIVPGGSRRAGLLLVALVAAAPMGIVWSMTYSEGLFCACAVWALVHVLRRNWLAAGCCTALAGLVRPTGAALLLAVGLTLLAAAGKEPRDWRVWAGGLVAPLGLLGYLGYVGWRTGSPMGWFTLQRDGWNSRFDLGTATVSFTRDTLAGGRSVLEVVTVAVLAGSIVLLLVCIARGVPTPLVVFAAGVMVMDLGSNGLMNSKARLLLPAVTLFVPVALALAKRQRSTALAVLAGVAVASAWFGGYALTGWSYAI